MILSSFLFRTEDSRGFVEHGQEVAHGMVRLDGMAERHIDDHRVDVAAAITATSQVPRVDEVTHDALRRPLGNPDRFGDVTRPDRRVAINADEDMSVVTQEGPVTPAALRHPFDVTHVTHA